MNSGFIVDINGNRIWKMTCPFCLSTTPRDSDECISCGLSLARVCRCCLKEVDSFGFDRLCLNCSEPLVKSDGSWLFTITCPSCGSSVHWRSEYCSNCGNSFANICRACLRKVSEFENEDNMTCLDCSVPPTESDRPIELTPGETKRCPSCDCTIPDEPEVCLCCGYSPSSHAVCRICGNEFSQDWDHPIDLCLACACYMGRDDDDDDGNQIPSCYDEF